MVFTNTSQAAALTNFGIAVGGAGGGTTGGTGGAGVEFLAPGSMLVNAGTIQGGKGALGGSGVVGNSLTLANSGSIAGGMGATQADAITFEGGSNTMALGDGSSISGVIDIQVGTLTFDQSALPGAPADVSIANVITGGGSVIKGGAGTLTLTGVNTYTGSTTISAGTLSVGADGNLGATSGSLGLAGGQLETTATFASARAVNLVSSGTIQVDTGTTTLSGVVGGGATLVKTGNGTLTLSGANSYAGGTILNAGQLSVSSDGSLGATLGAITFAGGTLETTASFSSARTVMLNLGGIVQVDTGTTTLSGTISGGQALTKTGAGTLTLAGASTYAGDTTIAAGTLDLATSATMSGTMVTTGPAGTGTIVFHAAIGQTATLALDSAGQPTSGATFGYTLADFGSADALELKGFGAIAGTSVSFANGTLTVANSSRSESFTLSNPGATQYYVHDDGQGGVFVDSVPPDTTPPARPAAPTLTAASDTGRSSTDGRTSDSTPTLTGTTEAGATITLYDNGSLIVGGAVAGSDGTYTITSSQLADGRHPLGVTATDAAGNTSAISAGRAVVIDTSAPAQPAAPTLAVASDTGRSSSDGITSDTTPTFGGTAEAGATVTLYDGTRKVGTATASSTGTYTVTSIALANGTHSLNVTATDVAGNASAASPGTTVTIDTVRPATPGAPILAAASDTGSSSSDRITMDTTPTFTGTAEAGSIVTLYDGSATIGSGTAASDGSYTITATALAEGTHSIKVGATDAAGNASGLSAARSVVIDTTAPSPTITSSGGATTKASQVVTGTGEAGTTVTLTDNGNVVGTAAVSSKGTWSSKVTLSAGTNDIVAADTDKAGNVGMSLAVSYDYTAASAPRPASFAASSAAPDPHADLAKALFDAAFASSHVETAMIGMPLVTDLGTLAKPASFTPHAAWHLDG